MGAAQEGTRQEPRADRPPRNGERGDRPNRGERGRGAERGEGSAERGNGAERGTGAEREERGDTRPEGRGRRPERAPRPADANRGEGAPEQTARPEGDMAVTANPVEGQDLNQASGSDARQQGGEGREKRSRDRYGRERGPRGERTERQDRPNGESTPASAPEQTEPASRPSYFDVAAQTRTAIQEPAVAVAAPAAVMASAPAPAAVAPVPVAPQRAAAVAPAAAPASPALAGMPKVQTFVLPADELAQIAQSAGLSWVGSDAAKIAAVQAAIAAEPKPAHVPRERPAPVVVESQPLVMVETKRDLRELALPFEDTTPQ